MLCGERDNVGMEAEYRADDRRRGDSARYPSPRCSSWAFVQGAERPRDGSDGGCGFGYIAAAAAAPPGEAILARTDATGAGAGVEGAYEAEMMEALAACGD